MPMGKLLLSLFIRQALSILTHMVNNHGMMRIISHMMIIIVTSSIIMIHPLQGCSRNNGGGGGTTSRPPTTGPPPTTIPPTTTAFPTSPPGTLFPTGLYSFIGDLVPGVQANISIDFPQEMDKINYVNVTVAAIHVYVAN
ncbi:hypothetical protein FOZ62_013698, partial [Perkinsus olseni]